MKLILTILIIAFISIGISCSQLNRHADTDINNKRTEIMQSYIDSSSDLYLKAINDVKEGVNPEKVKKQYLNKISLLHFQISKTFDSITSDYLRKKISQSKYDSIRQSMFFDSVSERSMRLSQLGIDIKFQ